MGAGPRWLIAFVCPIARPVEEVALTLEGIAVTLYFMKEE